MMLATRSMSGLWSPLVLLRDQSTDCTTPGPRVNSMLTGAAKFRMALVTLVSPEGGSYSSQAYGLSSARMMLGACQPVGGRLQFPAASTSSSMRSSMPKKFPCWLCTIGFLVPFRGREACAISTCCGVSACFWTLMYGDTPMDGVQRAFIVMQLTGEGGGFGGRPRTTLSAAASSSLSTARSRLNRLLSMFNAARTRFSLCPAVWALVQSELVG
mmetsp:Transcript_135530/g.235170  ORF Transcript_135530/g.235170 Transcript_135530/m.235170 type:complete len:214 (+) Transcript_135530:712-1353(+)